MKNLVKLASEVKIPGKFIFQNTSAPKNWNSGIDLSQTNVTGYISDCVKAGNYISMSKRANLPEAPVKQLQQLLNDAGMFDAAEAALKNKDSEFYKILLSPSCKTNYGPLLARFEKTGTLNSAVDGKVGASTTLAISFLQMCLGVEVDGAFGPQTLKALESKGNTRELFVQLAKETCAIEKKDLKEEIEASLTEEQKEALKKKEEEQKAAKEAAEKVAKTEAVIDAKIDKNLDSIGDINEVLLEKQGNLKTAKDDLAELKALQFKEKKKVKERIESLTTEIDELVEKKEKLVRENNILKAKKEASGSLSSELQERMVEIEGELSNIDAKIKAKQQELDASKEKLETEIKEKEALFIRQKQLTEKLEVATNNFEKAIEEWSKDPESKEGVDNLKSTFKELTTIEAEYDEFCITKKLPEGFDKVVDVEALREGDGFRIQNIKPQLRAIMESDSYKGEPIYWERDGMDNIIKRSGLSKEVFFNSTDNVFESGVSYNGSTADVPQFILDASSDVYLKEAGRHPVDQNTRVAVDLENSFYYIQTPGFPKDKIESAGLIIGKIGDDPSLVKREFIEKGLNILKGDQKYEYYGKLIGDHPLDGGIMVAYDQESGNFYPQVDGTMLKDPEHIIGKKGEYLFQIKATFTSISSAGITAIRTAAIAAE